MGRLNLFVGNFFLSVTNSIFGQVLGIPVFGAPNGPLEGCLFYYNFLQIGFNLKFEFNLNLSLNSNLI